MTYAEIFRRYEVKAASVADFLDRYYKPDRYTGRGEDYASYLLAYHQAKFDRDKFVSISMHDSVTGRVVAYFGNKEA